MKIEWDDDGSLNELWLGKKCAADVFAISRRFSSARVELD